jgi:hypothetical protein
MPRIRNQRPTNVDYYWRNREQELFRVKARQAGTREMLREWRDVPCADCGEKFEPHQMDFDHRDPSTKRFNMTAGRAALKSTAVLRAEADKCDVVCANCHRVRSQRQSLGFVSRNPPGASPRAQEKREIARAHARMLLYIRSVPCPDCRQTFSPFAMEFDHRDPREKRFVVTRMVGRSSVARILEEVAKCDVVCANCHRMRTYRQRHPVERE